MNKPHRVELFAVKPNDVATTGYLVCDVPSEIPPLAVRDLCRQMSQEAKRVLIEFYASLASK